MSVLIGDISSKRAALIELEGQSPAPRFADGGSFFKFACEHHGLNVNDSTYRGWFGAEPKSAKPELLAAMADAAGLQVDDPVIVNGTVREFRIAIGLDEPDSLIIVEDDPKNPFDYLASIDMSVQQTGDQKGIPVGGDANLVMILELMATRRIPEVECDVALSAVHVRLSTAHAKATEPIDDENFNMGRGAKASIRKGGTRSDRFWEIDAVDSVLVGTIDPVFTKLTEVENGEEITGTLSAFIKNVEPAKVAIRDERGNPLDHSARDLVLARLQTDQLTDHEMGLIKLGEHTLRFRPSGPQKGR